MKKLNAVSWILWIVLSVPSLGADFSVSEKDFVPYIKDKIQSVKLDHFYLEALQIQTKKPLTDAQIQDWVLKTMERMNWEKEHPKYEETYQSLLEQYRYNSANNIRKIHVIKNPNLYLISQKPLKADEIKDQETLFQNESDYYSTCINDYAHKKNYLIDHVNHSVLVSEESAWSEEMELLYLFNPEMALLPFAVISDVDSKIQWSLKKEASKSSSDFSDVYDFSYVNKRGIPGGQTMYFHNSDEGLLLDRVDSFSQERLIKQFEWSAYHYDPTLKKSIAHHYQLTLFDEGEQIVDQKEYSLSSYRLNDPQDVIDDVEAFVKTYKGYQLERKKKGSNQVEVVGIIGKDILP